MAKCATRLKHLTSRSSIAPALRACAGQFLSRGFVVLLRKSIPQNHNLKTAAELGVKFHMALADYIDRIKAWNDLPEDKRNFFVGDNYLPLSELHAERIKVLRGIAAVEFKNELLYKVPAYSIAATADFQVEEIIQLQDVWNDEAKIQTTRKWLHEKGIPYATQVFLIYDELIVVTEWKILVKYWDAFAYSVGVEMVAVDSTKSWTCTFHHEDVIIFRKYK